MTNEQVSQTYWFTPFSRYKIQTKINIKLHPLILNHFFIHLIDVLLEKVLNHFSL